MKNFIQNGRVLDAVAPSGGVVSGNAYMFNSVFGVAGSSKSEDETFGLHTEGVFELPKLSSDDMSFGQKLNWNDTNRELQLASSDLDNVASVANKSGAASGVTKVLAKLTPV